MQASETSGEPAATAVSEGQLQQIHLNQVGSLPEEILQPQATVTGADGSTTQFVMSGGAGLSVAGTEQQISESLQLASGMFGSILIVFFYSNA